MKKLFFVLLMVLCVTASAFYTAVKGIDMLDGTPILDIKPEVCPWGDS